MKIKIVREYDIPQGELCKYEGKTFCNMLHESNCTLFQYHIKKDVNNQPEKCWGCLCASRTNKVYCPDGGTVTLSDKKGE